MLSLYEMDDTKTLATTIKEFDLLIVLFIAMKLPLHILIFFLLLAITLRTILGTIPLVSCLTTSISSLLIEFGYPESFLISSSI